MAVAVALVEAQERGVQVLVIVDSANQSTNDTGAAYLYGQGVEVLVDPVHTISGNEVIIIDDATVISGGFNDGPHLNKRHSEHMLLMDGMHEMGAGFLRNFESCRAHCVKFEPGEPLPVE